MKKKIFILSLIVIGLFTLTGCATKDSKQFKEEYEKLNNTKAAYGDEDYRKISIPEDNKMVYATPKQILNLINSKETFYVYFGSPYCPWCRSVIEEAIKSIKENNIDRVYYVNIWDGFHEEILRDTYELDDNNKPKKVKDGTKEYTELLDKLDNVLSDYTLTTKDGKKVKVGEKRIYAPNFIYIENGKAKKLVSGQSKYQEKHNSKLTDKIIKDEKSIFDNFFKK